MASFTINGFDDVDKVFEKLSKPQYFQTKALEAAAPILVKETKNAIKSTGGGDKLARSFGATKPKQNKYGAYTVVKPSGRDKNGVEWVKRAAIREYGTVWPKKKADAEKIHHGRQAGQPKNDPKPWRQKAINAARAKCEDAMRKTIYTEVEKTWES